MADFNDLFVMTEKQTATNLEATAIRQHLHYIVEYYELWQKNQ